MTSPKDVDVFFVTIPWWDNHTPPCAPAVLKGIVESQGFKMTTWDSNIDLQWEICGNDHDVYNGLVSYFLLSEKNSTIQALVEKYYELILNTIRKQRTKFIAFSVFSTYTHRATFDLLLRLQSCQDIPPIILGGRGLSTRPHLSIMEFLTAGEKIIHFADIIRRRQLADHLIIGDGEEALVSLLNGENPDQPGIHHVASSLTLEYPFSNFDDIPIHRYNGVGNDIQLPVISSKGCVRSCDFCDVAAQMAKFQSKDGKRVAEEMIYLSHRYDITGFYMADSIANGNMKSLTIMCEHLAEYNAHTDRPITWSGNWISRPPGSIKAPFYDVLAASGCQALAVGAEHASNRVLEAMNKKTVVEGVYYDLEQFNRVGIKAILNIIVSHWSEEFQDYMQLYDFFIKQGRYLANGTISAFNLSTAFALDSTPMVDHVDHTGLTRADDNFTLLWYTKKNPKSTIRIRLARLMPIIEFHYLLNVSVRKHWITLKEFSTRMDVSADSWQEFFESQIDKDTFAVCQESLDFMDSHLEYFNSAVQQFFPTVPLKLKVNTWHCNGAPRLCIKSNGRTVYDQIMPEGVSDIDLALTNVFEKECVLEFGMTDKSVTDTQVDSHGNIVADKRIEFEQLTLDTVDLFNRSNFFYDHVEYEVNGELKSKPPPGLFLNNSVLRIRYRAPFWRHYLALPKSSWFIDEKHRNEMPALLQQLKEKIQLLRY